MYACVCVCVSAHICLHAQTFRPHGNLKKQSCQNTGSVCTYALVCKNIFFLDFSTKLRKTTRPIILLIIKAERITFVFQECPGEQAEMYRYECLWVLKKNALSSFCQLMSVHMALRL
jgi:hypothetical protein